jgi:hypothetical protein
MLEMHFARVIAAVEEVLAAFTAPAGQVAFYGQDDPGWIVRSECDLRVGGAWTVAFGPSPTELYRHHHVFEVQRVHPPRASPRPLATRLRRLHSAGRMRGVQERPAFAKQPPQMTGRSLLA